MGAGMMPKGGGVLGFDFFGNQGANPRPNLRDYSTQGANTMHPRHGGQGQAGGPPRQTQQQQQDFQQAERRWKLREEERRKRQDMYSEMAQTTGPTPKGVDVGQYKEAGDQLTMGAAAPAYEKALYGQPRKWRDQYASIVNLRTA